MNTNAILEQIRALLPNTSAVLRYVGSLGSPLEPVVEDYLYDHLGWWNLEVAHADDVGPKRNHQEDGVFVHKSARAFSAIDGMGGQSSGMWATHHVMKALQQVFDTTDLEPKPYDQEVLCPLWLGFRKGHQTIVQEAVHQNCGAGASAVGAWMNGTWLNVAHVGDSRAYLFREDTLLQLTHDHSLLNEYKYIFASQKWAAKMTGESFEGTEWEMFRGRFHNVILRALGMKTEPVIAWSRFPILRGDLILLCTDGLSDHVEHSAMEALLQNRAEHSLTAQCQSLLQAAIDAEASDNIALVLVRVV